MPTRAQLASFPWNTLDWLLVNEGEAGDLVELLREERDVPFDETDGKEEKDVVARATKLIHTLHTYTRISKTVNIICTLGAKGVLAFVPQLRTDGSDFQSKLVYVPAAPLDPAQVVDTTGAGDCFTGYFVAGLMEAKVERIVSKEDVERVLRRCVYVSDCDAGRVFGLICVGGWTLCDATWSDGEYTVWRRGGRVHEGAWQCGIGNE